MAIKLCGGNLHVLIVEQASQLDRIRGIEKSYQTVFITIMHISFLNYFQVVSELLLLTNNLSSLL